MTYLDICNGVLRRLREDEVTNVSADSYSKMVGDFINDAKDLVETAWDWSALRSTLTITTSADDNLYSITGSGSEGKLLNLINDTSNLQMEYQTQNWFDDKEYINLGVKILDDETTNNMPLNIIEERTVGPDLGQDSIDAGILSLIIGFLLVIIFMIYKYRAFGLIANLALITNLFLLIGILTLFEATLTLPGIAGIILTVGMAVDANVLIFERIRENFKHNIEDPKNHGFNSAYVTILDSNLTTLFAAIFLFAFGFGPIRGFSISLIIGIISSLIVTYIILKLFINITSIKYLGLQR